MRGSRLTNDISYLEPLSRHRKLVPWGVEVPEHQEDSTLVSDSATVVGNVKIGSGSQVWYGAVIRGEDGPVR